MFDVFLWEYRKKVLYNFKRRKGYVVTDNFKSYFDLQLLRLMELLEFGGSRVPSMNDDRSIKWQIDRCDERMAEYKSKSVPLIKLSFAFIAACIVPVFDGFWRYIDDYISLGIVTFVIYVMAAVNMAVLSILYLRNMIYDDQYRKIGRLRNNLSYILQKKDEIADYIY